MRSYQVAHPEKQRAATKRFYDSNPVKARERGKQQRLKNPDRTRAHQQLRNAVRRGEIVRPGSCSECGRSDLRIEAHHDDYKRPLDVAFLCSACHGLRRILG